MTTNLRQLFLEHVGQTSDNPMMLEVERAEGIYLYGRDGKRWIDLISGVSVSAVGHGNRQVIDAICSQAQDYLHLMVYGEAVESPQVRYAQRIASLLPDPLDTVYFVNSGSEAVEGALKLAKRYTGRTEIIYYKNAYHGSTHGSLSVMGGEEYRNAYRPLLPDTRQIQFNEPADLRYVTPAHGLRHHRTGTGRRRYFPGRPGLPAGAARPVRPDRNATDLRRNPDRTRTYRHPLLFPAVRHRPGHLVHGESFRRRYAAGRVHRVESNHVGAENQPGTGPHHHVRRTPGLLRRRARRPGIHPVRND